MAKRKLFYGIHTLILMTVIVTSCSTGSRKAAGPWTIEGSRISSSNQSEDRGMNEMGKTPDFLKTVRLKKYNDPKEVLKKLGQTPEPSDVEEYLLHKDGGLVYDILSREAKKTGVLNKYDNVPTNSGKISLGGTVLEYTIPKEALAYDVIPVHYTLSTAENIFPIHISVTAFEEESRRKGRDLYDMNIPGVIDTDFEYLGYVDGTAKPGTWPVLSPTLENDRQGSAYPSYQATDLIKSGTVKSTDITWLKFRYTNTGNTILDSEGNGTFSFTPELYRKEGSNWVLADNIHNLHERLFDYLYPGESGEMWLCFRDKKNLAPGEYKIVIWGKVRNEQNDSAYPVLVQGRSFTKYSFEFAVKSAAENTVPKGVIKELAAKIPPRNSWLHTMQEFMASYETLKAVEGGRTEGTIWLQVAPWTEELILKLILGKTDSIKTVRIPVEVDQSAIKIRLNKENQNYIVKPDGTRYPVSITQNMADMRSNVQRGPYPDSIIINDLLNMKEAGINVLCTTGNAGHDVSAVQQFGYEANKFMLDAARKLGFSIQAYANYPFGGHYNQETIKKASIISGKVLKSEPEGWGGPVYSEANAILTAYTFKRYGDLFWQSGNGVVPIDTEDTRGWLRGLVNFRHAIGLTSLSNFRAWLGDAYGKIDILNKQYNSGFNSFDTIDPEQDAQKEALGRDTVYNFRDPSKVYRDWSKAITDYDLFRSIERADNYKQMLDLITFPNPQMNIRTEGSNWLVAGINPQTTNSHYRHVYYMQRRNGMVAEVLQASGTVYAHSDYNTIPFTPSEVFELTSKSVEQGIIPMQLGVFVRQNDIAVNTQYGSDDWALDFNLKSGSKGAFVGTLRALFPWYAATYEAGGAPGVMWQDYLCNAFITSTQFKELKFYTQKINEMLSTPEGEKWARNFKPQNSEWKNSSMKKYSYPEEYIAELIKNTVRKNEFDVHQNGQ